MNINRNNYEEYFILYMDNELGSAERRQVEEFVQLHPDLQEELELLLQTKLAPDESVVFDNKEELFQSASISLSNYDEWLTLYVDNELTPQQKTEVESFIAANPAAAKDLALLQQTKLPVETVEFPNKESLYRREEKVRRIGWLRIAAAAVVLLAIGTTVLLVSRNNDNETGKTGNENVASNGNAKKEQPAVTTNNGSSSTTVTPNENTASDDDKTINPVAEQPLRETINPAEQTNIVKQDKNIKQRNLLPVKEQQPQKIMMPVINQQPQQQLAASNNDKKPSNNLPTPDLNPNVNPTLQNNKQDAPILANNNPLKQNDNKSPVTQLSNDTYNKVDASANAKDDEPVFANNSEKKGKLRGFFRKMTRNFEKRTNIDPTDNDDRLLVGGLAIKLK